MVRLHHEFFEGMGAPLHGHFSDSIRGQIRKGVESRQIAPKEAYALFDEYSKTTAQVAKAKATGLGSVLRQTVQGNAEGSVQKTVQTYRERIRRIGRNADTHLFFQRLGAPLYGHFSPELRETLRSGIERGELKPKDILGMFTDYHRAVRAVQGRDAVDVLQVLAPIRNFKPLATAAQTFNALNANVSEVRTRAENNLASLEDIRRAAGNIKPNAQPVVVGTGGKRRPESALTFKHVIMIPTHNRPSRMRRAVADILSHVKANGYTGQLKIIVVDDSTERPSWEKNRSLIRQLGGKLPSNVRLGYYGKMEQDSFIQSLAGSMPGKEGRRLTDFLTIDPSTTRRGFGGVRNLASLIALYHSNPKDIVTFFDDDTSMRNVYAQRQADGSVGIKFGHVTDHFRALDRIFADPGVNVVGGLVTKDILEAHELVPDALRRAGFFFKRASEHTETQKIENLRRVLSPTVPVKNVPYGQALKMMGRYASNVKENGTYPLRIRLYDPNKPLLNPAEDEYNDWLGGANISVRASALAKGVPYPTAGVRGEDVCWSKLMNHLVGGVRRANLPISHFKAGKRDVFGEIAQNVAYSAVSGNLRRATERTGKSHEAIGLALQNALSPATVERIIQKALDSRANEDQWRGFAKNTRALMRQNGWWNQPKYHEALGRIEGMLDHFSQPDIQKKIRAKTADAGQIADGLRKYGTLIAQWPNVLQGVQRLKATQPARA